VVHGLLFAGTVTVVTKLGPAYHAASSCQRTSAIVLLAISLLAFIVSVAYLLWAMSPYRPTGVEEKVRDKYKRVFFPLRSDLKLAAPFEPWRERITELQPKDILDELTAEALKLADVLHTESTRASIGYR
jgi:hypothetical protein